MESVPDIGTADHPPAENGHESAVSALTMVRTPNGDDPWRAYRNEPPSDETEQRLRPVGPVVKHAVRGLDGLIAAVHCRQYFEDDSKRVWWEQPDGTKGLNGLSVEDLPLYGINELRHNTPVVVLVEGEPARDALTGIGIPAVATVTGAGPNKAPGMTALGILHRAEIVCLWADNDEPGQAHMDLVARRLKQVGHPDIRVIDWAGAPPKTDAKDYIDAGGTVEDVQTLIQTAQRKLIIDTCTPGNGDERALALPAPPFPTDVFPPQIRALIDDGARALGCPVDMIAVPFLAYAAGIIGNMAQIEIKKSFRQRPILWTVVVAKSGSMKTPADKVARSPLITLQSEASERYDQEMRAYREALERSVIANRKSSYSRKPPTKPELEHFYSTDATFEALGPMLKAARGIVVTRDEIVGLVKACDAYRGGRGGDRQKYLEGWDGTGIKIDRRTHEPLYIPRPVLCLAGGCQPAVLPELTKESNQHDGFIPRFLWSYPDVEVSEWSWNDVDEDLRVVVTDLLRTIRAQGEITVTLPEELRPMWAAFATDVGQAARGAHGIAVSVASKLTVHVARIALVLHCLWSPEDTPPLLDSDRLRDAIQLGHYFREHANRVLTHFDGSATRSEVVPLTQRVEQVLELRAGEWMTKSQFYDLVRPRPTATELDQALGTLKGQARAEMMSVAGKTKPSELWRIVI